MTLVTWPALEFNPSFHHGRQQRPVIWFLPTKKVSAGTVTRMTTSLRSPKEQGLPDDVAYKILGR